MFVTNFVFNEPFVVELCQDATTGYDNGYLILIR